MEVRVKLVAETGKAVDNIEDVQEALENVQDAAEDTGKEVQNTKADFTELGNVADKVTGGLVSKFKGAIGSINGMTKAFKGMRAALISTGIGALAVALGSIAAYFTSTNRGADQFSKIMSGLGTAMNVVLDRISLIGESIVLVFQGKFKEAGEVAAKAFLPLGDEMAREIGMAVQLEDRLQAVQDREIALIQKRSQMRAQIEKDKIIADDINASYDERIAALDRVVAAENKLLAEEQAIAQEKADIIKEQNSLGESSREDRRMEAEAYAAVADLEASAVSRQKESLNKRNALLKEQQGKEDAALAEEFKKRQEMNQAVEVIRDNSMAKLEMNIRKESQLKVAGMAKDLKAYQDTKKKEQAIDKITSDQKMALASQTLGAISGILGQNSKAGKAAGIAQALINTYQGITQVWKNETTLPEPFGTIQKIVASGTALASGMQAVRQIKQTQIPQIAGAGAGSFGGGGGGGSVPSAPSFNVVGSSGISQLSEIVKDQTKQPVKAYVVGKEVTTAQEMERNAVTSAKL